MNGKRRPGGIGRTRKGCSVVTTRSRRPFWLLVGSPFWPAPSPLPAPPAAAGAPAARPRPRACTVRRAAPAGAGPLPALSRGAAAPRSGAHRALDAFGVAGTVFAFGVHRSASVWRTRRPWRPLRTRLLAWLDALPLARRWPPCWQACSAAAWRWWLPGRHHRLLFGLQAVTGIAGLLLSAHARRGVRQRRLHRAGGPLRRGLCAIHHWAANGMIVLCVASHAACT
jgi:hypothetical protein